MPICNKRTIRVTGLVIGVLLGMSVLLVLIRLQLRSESQAKNTRSFRVVGGSMADVLLGAHYDVQCKDCRFKFSCNGEDPPYDGSVVCPNCGYPSNPLSQGSIQSGDLVTVDRDAYVGQAPLRWQMVAFRTPGDEKNLSVKRAVGLPGERVALRHGDLYVNGRVQQKSLDQLRSMAILVHDSSFEPSLDPRLPSRWHAESPGSDWQIDAQGYFIDRSLEGTNSTESSRPTEWLVYHHWPCTPSLGPRTLESPVKDHYAYNQNLSRKLHPVTDLLLICHVTLTDWEQFVIQIHNGRHDFFFELINQSNQIRLRREQADLSQVDLPKGITKTKMRLEIAYCDGRLLAAIDRRDVLCHNLESSGGRFEPNNRPLAIAASGRSIRVQRLEVLRDVHYLDPAGIGLEWSVERPMADDEVFVLGDNVPISVDSRAWKHPGLPLKLLWGKVLGIRF